MALDGAGPHVIEFEIPRSLCESMAGCGGGGLDIHSYIPCYCEEMAVMYLDI